MSQFWFDELNIITECGWRLHSQYSGYAGVNGRGEIIDLTIAGTNPTGERRQMPVEPDDGELYGDIVRSLRVDYANEILEAMDDWHSSSAATRADQQRDAAI
jgi:hypothetical protein